MDTIQGVVASKSGLKFRACESAFSTLRVPASLSKYDEAKSEIPEQPFGMTIMQIGATNRATGTKKAFPDADLIIALENGLVNIDGRWFDPVCIAVLKKGEEDPYISFGAFFPVPTWMVERVREKKSELGHIIQELAGGGEKDPMKWLSSNTISREALLSQAVQCALTPILFKNLYAKPL